MNNSRYQSRLIAAYSLLITLIINSAYLSYKYFNFYHSFNLLQSFDCKDDCDAVMMSPYAMFFGVPTPCYGLIYFTTLFVLFMILTKQPRLKLFFEIYLLIGCLSAFGLVYLLYYILHLSCQFCLLSHLTLLLFSILYCLLRKDLSNGRI